MEIREFTDIIKALRERPEWLDELRKLVLTKEVLELPSRMDRLAEVVEKLAKKVDQLAENQDEVRKQIAELVEAQNRLIEAQENTQKQLEGTQKQIENTQKQLESTQRQIENTQKQLESTQKQLESTQKQLGELIGWQRGEAGRREGERYERQTLKRAMTIFMGGAGGSAEFPHVQERLAKWLKKIFEEGKELSRDEDPTLADIIWWKNDKVIVVEVSIKVNCNDVMRALKRAKVLRRCGVDVIPVVIGDDWTSIEARERAKEEGVEWVVDSVPSEGVISFRRIGI